MLRLLKISARSCLVRTISALWFGRIFFEERLRVYMPLVCETIRMPWTSDGWHSVVASDGVPTHMIYRLLYVDEYFQLRMQRSLLDDAMSDTLFNMR